MKRLFEERERIGWAPPRLMGDAPSLYVLSRAWYSKARGVLLVECRPYLNDESEPPWLPDDGELLVVVTTLGNRRAAALRQALRFVDANLQQARMALAAKCPGFDKPTWPDPEVT